MLLFPSHPRRLFFRLPLKNQVPVSVENQCQCCWVPQGGGISAITRLGPIGQINSWKREG